MLHVALPAYIIPSYPPCSQLWRTTRPILANNRLNTRLVVLLTQQSALVEALLAWWDIKCWVLVEEINRLHVDLQDLAWHNREV